MKSMNERSVAPAMRMFGGSPISVAVPPMFEARISMITSGIGSMSSASASRNVIGTISRTVVRLSRNADSTRGRRRPARRRPRAAARARAGRRGSRATCRRPVGSVTLTISIIPASRPSVFQSIASIATLLVDRLREQQQHGAEQRDLGAVDALGGDDARARPRRSRRRAPSARPCQRDGARRRRTTTGRIPSRRRSPSHSAHGCASTHVATLDAGRAGAARASSRHGGRARVGRASAARASSARSTAASSSSRAQLAARPRLGLRRRTGAAGAIQKISQARHTPHACREPASVPLGRAPILAGSASPDGEPAWGRSPQHARLGLDEPAPDRVARQLDAVAHPELGHQVLAVALDRLAADRQQLRRSARSCAPRRSA